MLEGKVAIITGAAKGIGKAIALEFARKGANLVIGDLSEEVEKTKKEVEALGVKCAAVKADVTKLEDVQKMVDIAIQEFGRIDILVNNAGIYPFKSFVEMEEEDWDKVMNVNLKGVFYCTKAVVNKMIEQKSGVIINIASIAGHEVGFRGLTHYSATKAGVVGFTKALALELAPHGIRVVAVAPGPIETPGTSALDEEMYEQMKKMIPLGRWGKAEEIAKLVAFLASEDAGFITGTCVVADGGFSAQ